MIFKIEQYLLGLVSGMYESSVIEEVVLESTSQDPVSAQQVLADA